MTLRIHCRTYRQLAELKVMLDKLGKKLAAKDAERLVVPKATTDCKPSTEGGE